MYCVRFLTIDQKARVDDDASWPHCFILLIFPHCSAQQEALHWTTKGDEWRVFPKWVKFRRFEERTVSKQELREFLAAMERLREENTMSVEKARQFLKDEGYLTERGEVAPPYWPTSRALQS